MNASAEKRSLKYKKLSALFLLSAALIAYEIQLMQYLSIVQWHHFASGVISIALLGFGASGTVISLFRKHFLKYAGFLLPFFMIISGLSMSGCFVLSASERIAFDSYTLFVEHGQILKFIFACMLYFLPFFFGATAIGLMFITDVPKIGTYYFSNLAGSGIGGILIILLLQYFFPWEIPQIISVFPVLSGLLLVSGKTVKYLIPLALVSVGLSVFLFFHYSEMSYSQYKSISYALNLPDAKVSHEENSPFGFMQTVSSPFQRYAPGLSLNYTDEIPSCDVLFNNGNWCMTVQKPKGDTIADFYDHTTATLPYALFKPEKVLIFGTGGGLEIPQAINNDVKKTVLVEPNGKVTDLLKYEYAEMNDSVYLDPRLEIIREDYRTFISSSDQTYDLIILPYLGEFGGSVGLNALNENTIMTVEAFEDMLQKLNPNGMITVSLWNDLPPKISLRTAALISAGLQSEVQESTLNSVLSVRSWGTITFVFKPEAFDQSMIQKMKAFCDANSFDPFLYPGIKDEERITYNLIEDTRLFTLIDGIFSEDAERIINTYEYTISAPVDNRPYFFQFLKIEKFPELLNSKGGKYATFQELGYFILFLTILIITVFAVLFILLPLFGIRRKKKISAWVFLWFSALGLAYMFVEIVLIKQFVMFLGRPVYSAAAVISVMLISSGTGSLYSSKLTSGRRNLLSVTGIIVLILLAYSFILAPLLNTALGLPFILRLLISLFVIALPGFVMGMPFPLGLRHTETVETTNVPWAWGINGCVSVISTNLAVIIAVEYGFKMLMFFGATAYFVAFISLFLLKKNKMIHI